MPSPQGSVRVGLRLAKTVARNLRDVSRRLLHLFANGMQAAQDPVHDAVFNCLKPLSLVWAYGADFAYWHSRLRLQRQNRMSARAVASSTEGCSWWWSSNAPPSKTMNAI